MKKLKIEVLKNFDGFLIGDTVDISCNAEGTALDQNWRRRIKDATTDQCCKVITKSPKARKTTGDNQ